MKKLIAVSAVLGVYSAFYALKAKAWFGDTHKDILKKALELLDGIEKQKYHAFYYDYTADLAKGAVDPDKKGDIDKGSGMHYYCAADKNGKELEERKGYYKNRLGKFKPSARTLLEENYTSALSLYKSGRKEQAMYSLGRAVHFIQDIGCTVHASGIMYADRPSNPHYAFEKHAQTKCKSIDAPNMLDKRVTKAFESGLGPAANRLSKLSSRFAGDVLSLDPKIFDTICLSTIHPAQQYTAGLLIKFYNDVNSNNGNFLCDGKSYTFKNELTGGYLTVAKKGLVLDAPNGDCEQRFTAVIKDDGTFGLKLSNDCYVGKNLKGFDTFKRNAEPSGYRFSALGNRKFRISPQGSDFKKVVTANRSGDLLIKCFDPEDEGNIWIIS